MRTPDAGNIVGGLMLVVALVLAGRAAAPAEQASPPPFSSNDAVDASKPPATRRGPASAPRADEVARWLEASDEVADVPLAVAAFPLAPSASGPTKVLVAVEVGRRQILPDSLVVGVRAFDGRGDVAFNGIDELMVAPVTPAVASPLVYTGQALLPPGRYRLRVVVMDAARRIAAVDHPVEVPRAETGSALVAGSLMLGPPASGGALRPLARSEIVRTGSLAWVDLRAAQAAPLANASVGIEVLGAADGPVLAGDRGTIEATDPKGTSLARATLPVALLPPGVYVARLIIDAGSGRTVALARPFTLGRLPPPDASGMDDAAASLMGAFSPDQVLAPAVLGPVLVRALEADPSGADDAMRAAVATVGTKGLGVASVRPFAKRRDLTALMLRGAVLLRQRSLEEAASAFREALRVSSEFLPAIVYLGACYAAGGRDREAVGAWQTALVSETDTPLVFTLAADGLIRLGDTAQAVSLLAEAAARWPGETALVTRHALALAAREGPARALDLLQPALEHVKADNAALVELAARLAVASAARGDDGAAARVARVRNAAARTGHVPPLLDRWADYLGQAGR